MQDPCLGLGEIGNVVVKIIEGITKILSTLIDSCFVHQCCELPTTIIEGSCDLLGSFANSACWKLPNTLIEGICGSLDTLVNTKVGVAILENVCGLSGVLSSCLNYCFRDFAWRTLDIICTHLECTAVAPCPFLWPLMCISQLGSALGIVLGSSLLPMPL